MGDHKYHAFISHNSADKPDVESISVTLEANGVRCFLDKWDILPSDQWLRNLETALSESRTILIFIGAHGIGPYQQAEADAALRRQIQQRHDCVIPILLPGASPEDIGRLSLFLQGTNALRFYHLSDPLPHRILLALVRGEDPNYLRQLIRTQPQGSAGLLQSLNHWLGGLHIEWNEHEDKYRVSEGQGKSCLLIPDLSESPNPDSIEYLLNWKSRLTPMLGRELQLKALHRWADAISKISVRFVIGEGGVGKTRLAFEFATQLKEKGWQAGEVQGLEGSWFTGSPGTLLIIDYPEQRSEKVTALLEALAVMSPPERKLRILLLGRNGDFLNKLPQTALSLVAPPIELPGFAMNDSASWDLFQQAWQRLHELERISVPPLPMMSEAFRRWRQQTEAHTRPLFILALAIRLMLDPNAKELSGKEIIRALTQQYEVIRLKKEAKRHGIDEYSLVMLRALSAIPGRLESNMLRQLIQESVRLHLDIRLPELRQFKDTSLWSRDALHAVQPDLLAADLLHYVLTELAGDQSGQWQYCGLEAAIDVRLGSSVLGRLIYDAGSILGHTWPLQSLMDWVCDAQARCDELGLALNRNYLERTLLPMAIAVEKALLMRADSPQTQGAHLRNLSIRLSENGEWDAALQASQREVAIQEQLASDNLVAYEPDLALSLTNLSNRMAAMGKQQAALQAIEQSIAIYERLAKINFGAYGPALASSLHNSSKHLSASGERDAALRAIQLAVEIRARLPQDDFAAYGSALAESLNSLSFCLGQNGEHEAALLVIQQTVAIHEQLAASNFAAYGAVLAGSLNNLSACLANNGKRGAGLQAIQRAVAIREQLAQDNFAVYGSALAESLNNLSNDLAESTEYGPALQAIERSVEIREQLAQENFIVYGPGLTMSLNNLSNRLAENEKFSTALQVSQRATAINERLAEENFLAHGPALAMSLHNVAIRHSQSGEPGQALQAIRRSVEIYERLVVVNFAAHAPALATSLYNLLHHLIESGDRGVAVPVVQRFVEVREQMAQKNFTTHGPELAKSLNRLSNTLADHGEYCVALQMIQRVVDIYEQLASDNFTTYAPHLSGCLNNLSIRLGQNGELDAALQAIKRALLIRERLVTDDFATYAPDFAASLHNLATDLIYSSEWETGLQACLRAVEIREQLAAENLIIHGTDLAGSLNNLSIYLTQKGEQEESQRAVKRAVNIYEQLEQKNLSVKKIDWAASLANLSAHLRRSGEHGQAIQAIQEAVQIYEQLASENFAPHAPLLVGTLHNLAIYLAALDQHEKAVEAKVKLESIKQRIFEEQVHVPPWLFPLFEDTRAGAAAPRDAGKI